jgi:hypothetical protein
MIFQLCQSAALNDWFFDVWYGYELLSAKGQIQVIP